ncbi:MAG: bifunctional phosphoribosyl-AMP cyclohydrolase/phosphoribosyl-ATP diphosphatase HisIE [Rikenellaceae bacterium]
MKNFNELDFGKNKDGLIPAIIQDNQTLRVLMLGYMSKGSLALSLESGNVTFYSRSRQRLWTKGETSGNFLKIITVDADCDGDTLLIKAEPRGVVCHKGTTSCFGNENSEGFIRQLAKTIKERHTALPADSYTTMLFKEGVAKIAQKVGEEAVETVIEAVKGDRERLKYEISDLAYHLLVLMENENLTISDIEEELYKRKK